MLGLQPKDVRGMLFEDALVHKHNRMLILAAQAMGADPKAYPAPNPRACPNLDPHPDREFEFDPDEAHGGAECDPSALQILVAEAIGQRVELECKIMKEMQIKTKLDMFGAESASDLLDQPSSKYAFRRHQQTMIRMLQRYECMVADSIGDLSSY